MPIQRLLFADDDVLSQWVTQEVLITAGFDVVGVCLAQDAIDLVYSSAQQFDLLLADIDLPDDYGCTALARAWVEMAGDRPMIYTGSPLVVPPRLAVNHCFLEKPYAPTRLLSLVDFLLEDANFYTTVRQSPMASMQLH